MLELSGGVGLGVDVGDLLELQGSLQADGVVDIPADEKDGFVVEVDGGIVLDGLPVLQHPLHLGGEGEQLLHQGGVLHRPDGVQQLGKAQGDEVDHRQLGGIGLGGGHGDLRPGPGVEHIVGLPGDGGAHHIDDGEDAPPQPLGLPESGQGIDGLSGLADDQTEGPVGHQGVAVAELRGQGHLHRLAQKLFQDVFSHHAHMVGGAAGDNVNLIYLPEVGGAQAQFLQRHPAVLNPGEDGVPEGLGLLHDLLGHEVLIAALLRGGDLPIHMMALLLHGLEVGVAVDLDALPGEDGNLPVLQVAHLPGVLEEGGDVAGQEAEAVAAAQDQGAVLSGGDELVGAVGAQNAQGVGPLDAVEDLGDGLHDVPPVVVLQKLGHHLGVGLGDKAHPLGLQEFLDLGKVFDDAVVDHGYPPRHAHMGVGVDIGGLPVGGPAGMAQAHGAADGLPALHDIREDPETPLGLHHL